MKRRKECWNTFADLAFQVEYLTDLCTHPESAERAGYHLNNARVKLEQASRDAVEASLDEGWPT